MKRILISVLSIFFLFSCGCSNKNPDTPIDPVDPVDPVDPDPEPEPEPEPTPDPDPVDPGGPDGPIDPVNPPEPEEDDIFDRAKAKEWAMTFPKDEALPNKILSTWQNRGDDKSKDIVQEALKDLGADDNYEGKNREVPSDEVSNVIDTIKIDDEHIFNLNADTFDSIFREEVGISWVFSKDDSERLVAQEGDENEGHSLIYNHNGYLVAYYAAVNYTKVVTETISFNISYVISEQFIYNT